MTKRFLIRAGSIALAMTGALVLPGCGGDDDGDQTPAGSPPTIEALTFDPKVVPAKAQSVIIGQFTFHDAESDADRFAAAITTPNGTRQALPPSKTQGTSGQQDGQVGFMVAVGPPVAGTYTLELWMVDEAGNESNHLDGTLEASAPQ